MHMTLPTPFWFPENNQIGKKLLFNSKLNREWEFWSIYHYGYWKLPCINPEFFISAYQVLCSANAGKLLCGCMSLKIQSTGQRSQCHEAPRPSPTSGRTSKPGHKAQPLHTHWLLSQTASQTQCPHTLWSSALILFPCHSCTNLHKQSEVSSGSSDTEVALY